MNVQTNNFVKKTEGNAPDCNLSESYTIISNFAYLIGVPHRFFKAAERKLSMKIFQTLEDYPAAKIVRNLCILRSSMLHNYGRIINSMNNDYKSIFSLPEYIPTEVIEDLSSYKIIFHGDHKPLSSYIIDINRELSNRVNNCKYFFPKWLDWTQLRSLFIMSEGLSANGVENSVNLYIDNINCYPYRMYINWLPMNLGNILANDKKFLTVLTKKVDADKLVRNMQTYIQRNVYLNFQDMFYEAFRLSGLKMTLDERTKFYQDNLKIITSLPISVDSDGNVTFTIRPTFIDFSLTE